MKKSFIISLIILAAGMLFTGCDKFFVKTNKAETQNIYRIIVDHTGREVEVPQKIERIVIGSMIPLSSAVCMYTGSAEKIVGMHPISMAAAKNSYLSKVYPEILKAETGFVKNGAINAEELLLLKPDVVLYPSANEEERKIYEKAGIPAVGFAINKSGFNTIETFADWMELFGRLFGDTGRADKIIAKGRKIHTEITEKTAALSEEKKPGVLILVNYDNTNLTVAGTNFFGQYWIETAGGRNVAAEVKGQAKVNLEQIYEWNPDIILITNFSPRQPEDFYNNTIQSADWSKINAVQNKKVYKFPLGMYRWFPPSSDTPLALQWVAKKIQPDLFKELDLDKEIIRYYKENYNADLTQQDLQEIYNPQREASGK